jgi:hypothetical protein
VSVGKSKLILAQSTTYTEPWWGKKRDGTSETIIVSDVCINSHTYTVTLTDYVANVRARYATQQDATDILNAQPTLTATSTVFEATATYLSVFTTV